MPIVENGSIFNPSAASAVAIALMMATSPVAFGLTSGRSLSLHRSSLSSYPHLGCSARMGELPGACSHCHHHQSTKISLTMTQSGGEKFGLRRHFCFPKGGGHGATKKSQKRIQVKRKRSSRKSTAVCGTKHYLESLDRLSGKNYSMRYTSGKKEEGIDRVLNRVVSKEMREDINRRKKYYSSDWVDGIKNPQQTVPAILFLYFACLAPAVSFGTIASEITYGSIGVVEFLLSSGFSGMAYAVLCGQPMAFIAPTGLTLAFISGLFRFCSLNSLPFFPVYAWVGIWTSFFMVSLGLGGASKLIRYCTRFTDEIFNALLSVNFIYEAISSLRRNFTLADPMNLTMPFVALFMALSTKMATMQVIAFQSSKFLNQKARTIVKNFGPVTIIVLMSLLNLHPWFEKFGVPTLSVPAAFELSGGRDFLVPLKAVSPPVRLLCALPAMLLTSLFFMDQNISVRVVNNPDNQLRKGPAYNLDMVALGVVTAALSITGLPWMCGATVQSMNHLKAMTHYEFNKETKETEIESVTETRLTGFVIHAMIASTIRLLPLLSYLPIPVVSGVFLFLGRKLMSGNSFLSRIRDAFAEKSRLADDHPIHTLGRRKMNAFTVLQLACLGALWAFKQCSATAIFFPSVIGILIMIRLWILPKFFTTEELTALGDAPPQA